MSMGPDPRHLRQGAVNAIPSDEDGGWDAAEITVEQYAFFNARQEIEEASGRYDAGAYLRSIETFEAQAWLDAVSMQIDIMTTCLEDSRPGDPCTAIRAYIGILNEAWKARLDKDRGAAF